MAKRPRNRVDTAQQILQLEADSEERSKALEEEASAGISLGIKEHAALPGNSIIHHGDCLEIMRGMPSETIGAVITSPPYNLRNSSGNGLRDGRGGKWENAALLEGYKDHEDTMPHDVYVAWQRECLNEMMRLLRPDGAIFYNHKWRVQKGLLQDRSDIMADFPVRQIIIWHRRGGINFNPGYFLPNYEVIYLIAKPAFRLRKGANSHGSVWSIQQEMSNPHPAPFPLELVRRCISAVEAGPVLDPFLGSGTTAIAAMDEGMSWVGIEKSAEYVSMATDRVQMKCRLLSESAIDASLWPYPGR